MRQAMVLVDRLKHSFNSSGATVSTSCGGRAIEIHLVRPVSFPSNSHMGWRPITPRCGFATASRALAHTPACGSCLFAASRGSLFPLSAWAVAPMRLPLSRPASAAPSPSRSFHCSCAGQKGIPPVSACVFRHRSPQYHLQLFYNSSSPPPTPAYAVTDGLVKLHVCFPSASIAALDHHLSSPTDLHLRPSPPSIWTAPTSSTARAAATLNDRSTASKPGRPPDANNKEPSPSPRSPSS